VPVDQSCPFERIAQLIKELEKLISCCPTCRNVWRRGDSRSTSAGTFRPGGRRRSDAVRHFAQGRPMWNALRMRERTAARAQSATCRRRGPARPPS